MFSSLQLFFEKYKNRTVIILMSEISNKNIFPKYHNASPNINHKYYFHLCERFLSRTNQLGNKCQSTMLTQRRPSTSRSAGASRRLALGQWISRGLDPGRIKQSTWPYWCPHAPWQPVPWPREYGLHCCLTGGSPHHWKERHWELLELFVYSLSSFSCTLGVF